MGKPAVRDPELASHMDDLYRDGAKVGSGSTADAVRHERLTNTAVGGKLHTQKAENYAEALRRWLRKNPNAKPGDRAAAENVLKDLEDALKGH